MKKLLLILATTSCFASAASWQLDPEQSSLNFVSVKNTTVAETHQFTQLSGTWSEQGLVKIQIPVSSLETHIPIRNERMLDFVLKAKQYATINAEATIEPSSITDLAIGKSKLITLPLSVSIVGENISLMANIRILKLNATTIQATTESPLMLNIDTVKLTADIDKLQQLAKLNDIDTMVPITFSVNFSTEI